ncbi:M50 family metallopeptidase [bacterium]|nr:M50 family metallopeptidase [bacterium]
MFKSWKIGRIAGIDVYLHSTFLLLLAFTALSGLAYRDPLLQLLNLGLPLMLFSIVVLHELGHALAARHYGVGTREITLYPIGGVARLQSTHFTPEEEMAVSAAGPAVNFALAGAAWGLAPILATTPLMAFLISQFLLYNLGLALFNLVPAFPMDGGRILRAFLSRRQGHVRATLTAASWGQRFAWVFGLVGLITASLNLVLLGLFVWLAAGAERSQVSRRWYF